MKYIPLPKQCINIKTMCPYNIETRTRISASLSRRVGHESLPYTKM